MPQERSPRKSVGAKFLKSSPGLEFTVRQFEEDSKRLCLMIVRDIVDENMGVRACMCVCVQIYI